MEGPHGQRRRGRREAGWRAGFPTRRQLAGFGWVYAAHMRIALWGALLGTWIVAILLIPSAGMGQIPPPESEIAAIRFGQDFSLYVMAADGSDKTRLQITGSKNGNPQWSPDGTEIAYINYDTASLHVVTADGLLDRIVVDDLSGPNGCHCDFEWSPDGQWIVYAPYTPTNGPEAAAIWVVRRDGTERRQITDRGTYPRADDISPTWSPDGRRIAFVSDRTGTLEERDWEIYVVNADGTGLTQLTSHLEPASALSTSISVYDWSPDGTEILFIGNGNVWTVNRDTRKSRRLTTGDYPRHLDGSPQFSPDGTMIAFHRYRRYPGSTDLFVWDRETESTRRLTHGDGSVFFEEWSPTGHRLIYTKQVSRRSSVIKTMAPDGTHRTQLTSQRGSWGSPSWRPAD